MEKFTKSRDTYKNINLDKSYKSLIELLWYSQLPCFDVVNVTTKINEEFGNSISAMHKKLSLGCMNLV